MSIIFTERALRLKRQVCARESLISRARRSLPVNLTLPCLHGGVEPHPTLSGKRLVRLQERLEAVESGL